MRSLVLVALAACGSSSAPAVPDAPAAPDAPATTDKASACASTFGNELTDAFGRLDGTVLAVVPPGHPTCAQPNGTHVVLQLTVHGAAYRMVLNLDVLEAEVDAPLAGGAWAEGWHPGVALDYVTTLHVASTAFTPHDPAATTALVTEAIALGAPISVFATSSGGTKADSAHLIHRNTANADGALVLDATTSPHYLLFRFANQTF